MTTCKPASGGIATEELLPLDQIINQIMSPVMRELYKNQLLEQRAHRATLQMLQDVVEGRVPLDSIAVSPDGWQMKAERPFEELDVKVLPKMEFMCAACAALIPVGKERILAHLGEYYHPKCYPAQPGCGCEHDSQCNREACLCRHREGCPTLEDRAMIPLAKEVSDNGINADALADLEPAN